MKRLSKNVENLKKVADSICEVSFSLGSFELISLYDGCATLFSRGRYGVGSSVLSKIPSNFMYRVSFRDGGLSVRIFI